MISQRQPPITPHAATEDGLSISVPGVGPAESSNRIIPRVVLLTPYTGGNLGDAAIQDAMIANLRQRIPNAEFSGISLNNENYLQKHGTRVYPICAASGVSFYAMPSGSAVSDPGKKRARGFGASLRLALRRLPGVPSLIKLAKPPLQRAAGELRHCIGGYRFLREHDVLIVCGGGQLDDEWGGSFGHPFALFKWAILAKLARVPLLVASVGAGKIDAKATRFFLSTMLRASSYRSYRDKNSKRAAAGLLRRAEKDSVVPDLAFSAPIDAIPNRTQARSLAAGRTITAVSPIVYAKPGTWPSSDRDLYDRYLNELADVLGELLERNHFLVFVWSARSDQHVVEELVARRDDNFKARLLENSCFATPATWKDYLSIVREADLLIASRLHSIILGFLAKVPVVAISFDPKVDWVMQDAAQDDSLLQISSFTAQEVLQAGERLDFHRKEIVQHLTRYHQRVVETSASQYDAIARMAIAQAGRRVATLAGN